MRLWSRRDVLLAGTAVAAASCGGSAYVPTKEITIPKGPIPPLPLAKVYLPDGVAKKDRALVLFVERTAIENWAKQIHPDTGANLVVTLFGTVADPDTTDFQAKVAVPSSAYVQFIYGGKPSYRVSSQFVTLLPETSNAITSVLIHKNGSMHRLTDHAVSCTPE